MERCSHLSSYSCFNCLTPYYNGRRNGMPAPLSGPSYGDMLGENRRETTENIWKNRNFQNGGRLRIDLEEARNLNELKYEPVSISYAISKFMTKANVRFKWSSVPDAISRKRLKARVRRDKFRFLKKHFRSVLKIKQIHNRWTCCKNRFDAVDFARCIRVNGVPDDVLYPFVKCGGSRRPEDSVRRITLGDPAVSRVQKNVELDHPPFVYVEPGHPPSAYLEPDHPASAYVKPAHPPYGYVEPDHPPPGYVESNHPPFGYVEPDHPPYGYVEPDHPPPGYVESNHPPFGYVEPDHPPSAYVEPHHPTSRYVESNHPSSGHFEPDHSSSSSQLEILLSGLIKSTQRNESAQVSEFEISEKKITKNGKEERKGNETKTGKEKKKRNEKKEEKKKAKKAKKGVETNIGKKQKNRKELAIKLSTRDKSSPVHSNQAKQNKKGTKVNQNPTEAVFGENELDSTSGITAKNPASISGLKTNSSGFEPPTSHFKSSVPLASALALARDVPPFGVSSSNISLERHSDVIFLAEMAAKVTVEGVNVIALTRSDTGDIMVGCEVKNSSVPVNIEENSASMVEDVQPIPEYNHAKQTNPNLMDNDGITKDNPPLESILSFPPPTINDGSDTDVESLIIRPKRDSVVKRKRILVSDDEDESSGTHPNDSPVLKPCSVSLERLSVKSKSPSRSPMRRHRKRRCFKRLRIESPVVQDPRKLIYGAENAKKKDSDSESDVDFRPSVANSSWSSTSESVLSNVTESSLSPTTEDSDVIVESEEYGASEIEEERQWGSKSSRKRVRRMKPMIVLKTVEEKRLLREKRKEQKSKNLCRKKARKEYVQAHFGHLCYVPAAITYAIDVVTKKFHWDVFPFGAKLLGKSLGRKEFESLSKSGSSDAWWVLKKAFVLKYFREAFGIKKDEKDEWICSKNLVESIDCKAFLALFWNIVVH